MDRIVPLATYQDSMQRYLFTSLVLVFLYLKETAPLQRFKFLWWILCPVLSLLPWISWKPVAWGNMYVPYCIFPGYRRKQDRSLELINNGRAGAATSGRLTKEEIANSYVIPAATHYAARLHISPNGKIAIKVVAKKHGQHLMYCERELHVAERRVVHNFMVLEIKGGASLALSLEQSIQLYSQLGIKRIELTAGLSVGGSFWPKLGFIPKDKAALDSAKKTIFRNLEKIPDTVKVSFEKETGRPLKKVVSDLLTSEEGQCLWLIRDLKIEGATTDTLPLGATLLKGARWEGYLSLEDPSMMKRLSGYIEKSKKPK